MNNLFFDGAIKSSLYKCDSDIDFGLVKVCNQLLTFIDKLLTQKLSKNTKFVT